MTSKRKSYKKKSSLFSLFALFIFFSLLTVVLLEYLDFKKGKESFIFKRIIHLGGVSDKIDKTEKLNLELMRFFNQNNIKYNYFLDKNKNCHFKFDIDQDKLKKIIDKVKKIVIQFNFSWQLTEVQKHPKKTIHLFHVEWRKNITHYILITSTIGIKKLEAGEKPDLQPKIAFIIDDVGNREGVSQELKKLNIPITASILPETPFAFDEANQIKQYGLQTMIHLPMQPKNTYGNFAKNFRIIRPDTEEEEIKNIIQNARVVIPHAVGINNHEGSLVTSKRDVVLKILKIIKKEGLFFVDSRTAPDTVAYDVARELKLKVAFRDVFLDSIQSYSYSKNQIQRLINIAHQKGKAIAIGHPFETTFQAIKDSINSIHDQGIKIVFVSQILD